MTFEFLPAADEEFREAARYYESEAAGVGLSFIAAQMMRVGIRKKVLRHFAYNLFYAVEADAIVAVAVAHHRKRPNYWRTRLKAR